MSFWDTVKYFKPKEFDSPDEPGSGINMHPILIKMLDDLRNKMDCPLIVTSGYRTKEHNKELARSKSGAVEDSAHCKGYASDLYCPSSTFRYKLISEINKTGFLRYGIGRTFVHVDMDPDKPQNVVWLYK